MPRNTPNPTAVGAFVIGAVAIAIGAIVLVGSGKYFKERERYVCLVRESVDGLQIGSKVTFKGVPVGVVSGIQVRFERGGEESGVVSTSVTPNPLIPVIIEMDSSLIQQDLGIPLEDGDSMTRHRAEIARGLRAKLKTQSLITGLLMIDLDYYPDAKPSNDPDTLLIDDESYRVIPTMASDLVELKQKAVDAITRISELDIEGITTNLSELLDSTGAKVEALDIEEFNAAVAAVKTVASSPKIDGALTSIQGAGDKVGETAGSVQEAVEEWEIEELVADARQAILALQDTIEATESMLGQQSAERQELRRALGSVADAADEVEELAAYVKEHPNSLLFGRKDEKPDRDHSQSAPTSVRYRIGPPGKP